MNANQGSLDLIAAELADDGNTSWITKKGVRGITAILEVATDI